jgi:two-component system cell cycle sensor histidine kinase/response regulator CckA
VRVGLLEVEGAAQRSADLTRQLLAYARRQTIAPRVIDLNKIVGGTLEMLRRLVRESIELVWSPGADLWRVQADPSQIDQLLLNLVVNAREAIGDIGRITIETHNRVLTEDYCASNRGSVPGEYVALTVSDDGCGMDSETLEHIFEPFFTTKEVGEGTGLGLATVYGIVKQNGGFITADSEVGVGTTLRTYLPRSVGKLDSVREDPQFASAVGSATLLLVEDEPAILRLGTVMLGRQGYRVIAASTPRAALRMAAEEPGEIHLLVTDVVMPEMDGRELARRLLDVIPNLRCLFMSGYTANVIEHHGVLDKGVSFLQKPFTSAELAAAVAAALDGEPMLG